MTKLKDHNSEESAYYVADYPFGRKFRCIIRYWVEKRGKGERFCRQTTSRAFNYSYNTALEDKTLDKKEVHQLYFEKAKEKDNLLWNKPKKMIYYEKVILYLDPETNYVQWAGLPAFANSNEIAKFAEKWSLEI